MKAALLYADDVELVSPGAVIISSVAALAEGGLPAMVELLGSFDDDMLRYLLKRDVPTNFREMLPLIPMMLDPDVARLAGQEDQVAQWRAQLEPALQQMNDLAEGLAKESGALDLVPALERRALHLQVTALEAGDPLTMVHQFTAVIEGRLRDPRRRVLFDAEAGKLAKSLMATSEDPSVGFTRAGQAAVGSGLIARLPAFPQAPMDELLDLRTDLSEPLRRYRSAVVTLSAGLNPGLGSQVEERIDDIWVANVEPAITEIEETLADHGLVRSLAKDAAMDIRDFLLSGAGVYAGLSATTTLGGAATVALGAVSGVAPATARAAWAEYEGRVQAGRHELFFLYEANRRLT